MNLLLFTPEETSRPLPRSDVRANHLVNVLRREAGDTFDAGLINGLRGKGTLVEATTTELKLSFAWGESPPPLDPITLVVGLPRPQTARDILRDATTLGVEAMHFATTEKSERSYAQSSLWSSGEWQRLLVTGAEQAFSTRLPLVSHGRELVAILGTLTATAPRVALDNYEGSVRLGQMKFPAGSPVVLAIGPERGWTAVDRELLRAHGFALAHLGERVLRTETAVVAALTLLKSARGLL
ncbi:MAG TPA: RsmE family RNA methyltransferase [Candidatus Didemnitutus sp.]|nr:RsmE family RNA methyltransferase [Candidatus Didemnitutus sp.]